MRGPRTWLLVAGLLVGVTLRVILISSPGSPDLVSWKIWSFAGSFDATALYGVGGNPPERRLLHWRGQVGTTEYPPLAIYEISAMGRV